jgi:hypothetical protein
MAGLFLEQRFLTKKKFIVTKTVNNKEDYRGSTFFDKK